MPNQFIETKTTSYGGRLANSVNGVIIGVILFIASFGLLYYNEGRVDLSTIAKGAIGINANSVDANSSLNGKLIYATDNFNTDEIIGDNLFLKPGNFLAVDRKVEMYSWSEKTRSHSTNNANGSETTEKDYTYVQNWNENPDSSDNFKLQEGHINPPKSLESFINKAQKATVGAYQVEMNNVILPNFSTIQIDKENTILNKDVVLANDTYLFVSKDKKSNIDEPQIGDLRISYSVLVPGNSATIFGKLDGDKISAYFDKNNTELYRIFYSSHDEALATMHTEYTILLWVLRIVGFLMMYFGLTLFFGPISALLDILPVFGVLSRLVVGLIALIVSIVLTLVTIFVSMVIHNIIALVIALIVTFGLIIFVIFKIKKRKQNNNKLPPSDSSIPPTVPPIIPPNNI